MSALELYSLSLSIINIVQFVVNMADYKETRTREIWQFPDSSLSFVQSRIIKLHAVAEKVMQIPRIFFSLVNVHLNL